MKRIMSHYKLNITKIPTYNDGSFLLYEINYSDNEFPREKIKKLFDDEFYYNELSLTDNIIFENIERDRKITHKIRIPQDKNITSKNVLEIDNEFYQVFNIYHFRNKDGYLESDITLQEYPSSYIMEEKEKVTE